MNSMSIAIVTDSVAYLTPAEVQKYNITVLPITVILGERAYPEPELSDADFYGYVKHATDLPTTSQVSVGQFESTYNQLVSQGVTDIISIHLSSGITSLMDNLRMLCKTYTKARVYPIDSMAASASEANLCLLAGQLIKAGRTAPEIVARLTKLRATQHVYFAVDSLRHLVRTGRLSNRSAVIGSLLNIKPLLSFNDQGQIIAIGKARTMHRALDDMGGRLAQTLAEVDYPVHATIINANNLKLAQRWRDRLTAKYPQVRFTISHLGPVIGVHTGEKTIGLIWERDWQTVN